jgi:RNA polymerase sigma factor (sigma-70 family)
VSRDAPDPSLPEQLLPMRLLSDARLARLASAGSARAFATLYERHHQALYRYCYSIVRNPQDAQDALQSALARAFAALRGRERDLAVRPWLFRIAHNEAVSILRRRRPEQPPVDELEPAAALDVEGAVDQRERLASLVADLQALPLRQRSALVMRELSGLSIEEIAGALSISPGVAKQTLFEARSSLQLFAEGRAMDCEEVRRAMFGDGRALRGRKLRAHLRACSGCREFRAQIDARSADLQALAPALPAAASVAALSGLLAHGAGHAGGAAAVAGTAASSHAAQALLVKGLVGVALVGGATAETVHLASSPTAHKHPPHRHHALPAAGRGAEGRAASTSSAAGRAATVAGRDARRAVGALGAVAPFAGKGSAKSAHGVARGREAGIKPESRRGSGKSSLAPRRGAGARGAPKHVRTPPPPRAKSRKAPPAKSPRARNTHDETPQGGSSGEALVPRRAKAPAGQPLQETEAAQPTASAPVTTIGVVAPR